MNREDEGEMAASRRRPRSPATGPLDDDDLLCEILLRLSPQPSSLPRASAVCKRWRRLVSDPGFFRRFRLHHRRNPPLLGFFATLEAHNVSFLPTLEAPNRVPPGSFSLPSGAGDCSLCLGCRHGLILIHLYRLCQVLVWDPVTRDQHRIALPAPFDTKSTHISGTVLQAAGDVPHFQVVLVAVEDGDDEQHGQTLAYVYSSQTGLWGDLISTPLTYKANEWIFPTFLNRDDAVLVGDSLYWMFAGNLVGILELDLVKQSLNVIRLPLVMCGMDNRIKIMRAEGGGLGVLSLSESDCSAQLWKRKTNCDGVTSWELGITIQLDKLLSLKLEDKVLVEILGFAQDNNVVLMWTYIGLFMIHLESLKFKKLLETKDGTFSRYHPLESVYTAEICAGGGHYGVELLPNTQVAR